MFFVFSFSFSAKKKKSRFKIHNPSLSFLPCLGLAVVVSLCIPCFFVLFFFFFFFHYCPTRALRVCPIALSLFLSLSFHISPTCPPSIIPPCIILCFNMCSQISLDSTPTPILQLFSFSLSLPLCVTFFLLCLFACFLSIFLFFFPCCTYHGFLPRSHLPCDYPHYLLPIVVFTLTSFARLSFFFFVALSLSSSLSCVSLCLQ